jgi:hypothetical protein
MQAVTLFCHIPKTAGTTFRHVLSREYRSGEILKLYGVEDEVEGLVSQYRQMPLADKKRIRVIAGHYPVGLHLSVPAPFTYLTFLRRPVERYVSFYHHVLSDPRHYAYEQGFRRDMSMSDFLEGGFAKGESQNGYVYYLSGEMVSDSNSAGALLIAKKNLEELFSVVGITERFDESVILMKQRLGWKHLPFYYHRKVTASHPARNLTSDLCAKIEQANLLDLALYEQALDQFESLIRNQGGQFLAELKFFRMANRLYQHFISLRVGVSRARSMTSL